MSEGWTLRALKSITRGGVETFRITRRVWQRFWTREDRVDLTDEKIRDILKLEGME